MCQKLGMILRPQRENPCLFRQGSLLARYKHELLDPDLRRELELAFRHPSETDHANSKQNPLKRAGFRDDAPDFGSSFSKKPGAPSAKEGTAVKCRKAMVNHGVGPKICGDFNSTLPTDTVCLGTYRPVDDAVRKYRSSFVLDVYGAVAERACYRRPGTI